MPALLSDRLLAPAERSQCCVSSREHRRSRPQEDQAGSFWTFGIFLAFVVETMLPGMVANRNIGLLIQNVWPMWLITFIVCALVFFGYPWWARRK
jgi:hypothetical protein